jgi:hypothetical protein
VQRLQAIIAVQWEARPNRIVITKQRQIRILGLIAARKRGGRAAVSTPKEAPSHIRLWRTGDGETAMPTTKPRSGPAVESARNHALPPIKLTLLNPVVGRGRALVGRFLHRDRERGRHRAGVPLLPVPLLSRPCAVAPRRNPISSFV